MFRFSVNPVFGSWLLVGFLLILLIAGVLFFTPKNMLPGTKQRRILLGLRFLMIFFFGLLMLRPSFVLTEKHPLPATLVMLFDLSESMTVQDESQGASRYETMKNAVGNAREVLKKLSEKIEIQPIGFGGEGTLLSLESGKIDFPEKPEKTETALGTVLLESLKKNAGRRVLGTILISDGTQRSRPPHETLPQDVALRYRDVSHPIYTISLGKPDDKSAIRDISVLNLIASDRVFVNNELTVTGQIRFSGYAGRTVPVQLLLENEQGEMTRLDQLELKPENEDQIMSYRFSCAPQIPGEWKLGVSASVQSDELVRTNNELSAFIRVIDGGLKVLYFEGTRRFEQKFLRLALESSGDIQVDYWRPSLKTNIKQEGKSEAEQIARQTGSRQSLVDTCFQPGKYNAYLLGDIDSTAFQPEELKAFADQVSRGTGLIVLTGPHSLAAGGYADTPLTEVFPVQLNSGDRVPVDLDLNEFEKTLPMDQRLKFDLPFTVQPVESESTHFLTQLSLDPRKNPDVWKELPTLDRVYRLGAIKPGAKVLATASPLNKESDFNIESIPVLVTQLFGTGRVALLATDSTWKWWMNGYENEHKRFWRQLILWCAKMDELLEGELAVILDRSRFIQEEPIDFQVMYQPKEGESLQLFQLQAVMILPDGTEEPLSLIDENGLWRGKYTGTKMLGDYRLKVSLLSRETQSVLKTAQSRFLVCTQNLELDQLAASPAVLENLSGMTGGQSTTPAGLSDLLKNLSLEQENLVDTREVFHSFYDSWFLFLLCVIVMTFDWFLRKRWGLV